MVLVASMVPLALVTSSTALAQEPGALGGSNCSTAPVGLEPGLLDFVVTVEGSAPVVYVLEAVSLPEYPGSLVIPWTPFGGAALWTQDISPGTYLLEVPAVSLTMVLTWDATGVGSSGDLGPISVQVTQNPVQNGGVKVHRLTNGVMILAPGPNYRFRQFVKMKITWKGYFDDSPVDGGCPYPMPGWTGQTGQAGGHDMGGTTTYVDGWDPMPPDFGGGANPDGYYPSAVGPDGNRRMSDKPDMLDPDTVAQDIQQMDPVYGGDPTFNVYEVTIEMKFTTYVINTTTGQVEWKIEWTYKETRGTPCGLPGPHIGGGGFGGPGPGTPGGAWESGSPTIVAANQMDAEHQAAQADWATGNYTGAACTW